MKNFVRLVFFFPLLLCAQNKTDSLKLALKNSTNDSMRCVILDALSGSANDDEWPKYNEQLKTIAEKNLNTFPASHPLRKFYLANFATALNNCAVLANRKGDIPGALEYYNSSLKIREEIRDKDGIGYSLLGIGLLYKNLGDIPKALQYYDRSLKIREEIGDKTGIAASLNNIGMVYKNQNDIAKALEYFSRSLKIQEESGDKKGISNYLINIGMVYRDKGDYSRAMEYMLRSQTLKEEIGDKKGLASCLNNIGLLYAEQGDQNKAVEFLNRSLKLREETNDKKGFANTLSHLTDIYVKQKNYPKALELALQDMKISTGLGFPENIAKVARQLNSIYKAKGNYQKALENYELFIAMHDSISNENTRKASVKNQLKYEYEKRSAADSVKNAEKQKVKDAQLAAQTASLKQEKFQRYSLVVGLSLVVFGLLFVINRFRITQKQKKIIEAQKIVVDEAFEKLHEKNKEVMDSIYYARRIQRALITSEKYIGRNLNRMN